MPNNNCFRHQPYRSGSPTTDHRLLRAELPPPIESEETRRRMRQVGRVLREQKVAGIYLVHGTFAGTDALGMIRGLDRFAPGLGGSLRRQQKPLVDTLAGQLGNYSTSYAELFSRLINADGDAPIPVRLFHWSSENNHVGRANGAITLLHAIMSHAQGQQRRFLLWGHSHAGNVFALLTNLLAGTPAVRRRFFAAVRPYYRWPATSSRNVSVWRAAQQHLAEHPKASEQVVLDIATFGTPVRYGWDTQGYRRLIHFIHHRPADGVADYRVPFPFSPHDAREARHGDYVQQLGIAGTNLRPNILAWFSWKAERRLRRVLQPGLRRRDTWDRLCLGQRVPAEGDTLLVDYPASDDRLRQHLFGHAIYTHSNWLLFHAEEVAKRIQCPAE